MATRKAPAKKATKKTAAKKAVRKAPAKKAVTKRKYTRKPKAEEVLRHHTGEPVRTYTEEDVQAQLASSDLNQATTAPSEAFNRPKTFAEASEYIPVLLLERISPIQRVALAVMLEKEGYLLDSHNSRFGTAFALMNNTVMVEVADIALKFNHDNKLITVINKAAALQEDVYSFVDLVQSEVNVFADGPHYRPADSIVVNGVEYVKA